MNASAMPLPDPRRSALIVIDVQNDFCHPEGFMAAPAATSRRRAA